MIVVTVGTQLPFDRLIQMIDEIAPSLDEPVFAQIGATRYRPKKIEWCVNMKAADFERKMKDASVVVSHAGIGSVLKAGKLGKPIILVPRRAALGEHRNDHQLATVSQLKNRKGIYVAEDKEQLHALLESELESEAAENAYLPERVRLQAFITSAIADASQ